jgi:hypothetical protein
MAGSSWRKIDDEKSERELPLKDRWPVAVLVGGSHTTKKAMEKDVMYIKFDTDGWF